MFRLISLSISKHKVLGAINLDFCNQDDGAENLGDNSIFTSVIIGANGVGKSYLLRAIVDIFIYLDELYNYVPNTTAPQFYFSVKFLMYGQEYCFTNQKLNEGRSFEVRPVLPQQDRYTGTYFYIDSRACKLEDFTTPLAVIASTMTVTDKFLAKSLGNYYYKGIRNENSPSSTGTRTMVRKAVSSLLNSLEIKEGFIDELHELLEHIELQPKLTLSYSFRYKNVFLDGSMNPDKLREIYENQERFFNERRTKIWGSSNFEKIKDDEESLALLSEFMNKLARTHYDRQRVVLTYDVLEEYQNLTRDKKALELLSSLDLLTFPSLKVYKKNQEYEFEQSSSGETHLLCQMLGIMSDIKNESLILIDEPENSSHPNWQMKYIGWLKDIFHNYSSCHFIIATHSHFLLTNLKPNCSNVIALERSENGVLKDVAQGVNPYCWSVDDILYRVFHVRNTRNYVFESKIFELYDLIEHGANDKERVRLLVDELNKYKLNEDDPLCRVIRKGEECLI